MRDFHLLSADLLGLALAAPLAVALVLLPAALVCRALARIAPDKEWQSLTLAMGFACVPLLDAIAIRAVGPAATLVLHVGAAAAGLLFGRSYLPRLALPTLLAALLWWAYLAVLYVDVDVHGRLYQSLLVLDLVKHAAVVRDIGTGGLPLHDPFVLRHGVAGYYHYFYDLAAVVDLAGGKLIDPRMAFVGAAFACGIAFAQLLQAYVRELGWLIGSDARLRLSATVVCAVGGLDLMGLALRWSLTGILERNSEWWDDEISLFATSASWVPHHLAAVIACFVAILLLSRAQSEERRSSSLVLAAFSGIASACALGLSVWVWLGAVVTLAISPVAMWKRGVVKWTGLLACSAIVAALLSVPQLCELIQGRSGAGAPLGLWVRDPAHLSEILVQPPTALMSLALTPFVWLIEFGLFGIAAFLVLRNRMLPIESNLARLLLVSLTAGLVLNLFVRSVIINNDFGWRVAWFAAFPAMLMTLGLLQKPVQRIPAKPLLAVAACLGLAATLYNAVAARLPAFSRDDYFHYINADPSLDYALARAYRWASEALPGTAVLQHNAAANRRSVDFGLYGTQHTWVADEQATLFGAPPDDVARRVAIVKAIFEGRLPISAAGGAQLVVTDNDPLWKQLTPQECIYRSLRVCITRRTT